MFKKASIIIPALNEEKHIGRCLKSVLDLDNGAIKIEVIVVDNGSTDRTVEIARSLGATVLIKPGVNVSSVRNYGVENSSGDLLAFVDADCMVSKGWLKCAVQTMEAESADAVGSFHIIPKETGWVGRTAELVQSIKVGSDVRYIPSGNMLVKRQCFEAVVGFAPSLETSEDVDFCNRLKKHGYKMFLNTEISSVHLGSPSGVAEMFSRELWHGKSMCTVFFRDLLAVRNLRLFLFSAANLVFLIGTFVSLYPLFRSTAVYFAVFLALYILLNLAVALNDWRRIRRSLPSLFFYSVIYGLARSSSIVRWLASFIF